MAVSKSLRYQILRRDNHTCRYCGRSAPEVKLTVDHVVPEALGGSDDPTNLTTACGDCNGGKSATPPDAAQVAGVADDAIRWARARQAAAASALVDLSARQDARDQFEQQWNAWTHGGRPLDLPPTWPQDVDRLTAAGLPLPLLLDAIDIAMGAKHVRSGSTYKYMCGVAWKRIRAIDEAASAAVVPAQNIAGTSKPAVTVATFVHGLLADADDEIADSEDLRVLLDAQVAAGGDDSTIALSALICYIRQLREGRRLLQDQFSGIYVLLSGAVRQEIRQFGHDEVEMYDDLGGDVALTLSEMDFYRYCMAADYLGTLGDAQAADWIRVARTLYPEYGMRPTAIEAAKIARAFIEGGWLPRQMCEANLPSGATCPELKAYQVTLDPCSACADACAGHALWCDVHLRAAIDGQLPTKSGNPIPISDFSELPSGVWDF